MSDGKAYAIVAMVIVMIGAPSVWIAGIYMCFNCWDTGPALFDNGPNLLILGAVLVGAAIFMVYMLPCCVCPTISNCSLHTSVIVVWIVIVIPSIIAASVLKTKDGCFTTGWFRRRCVVTAKNGNTCMYIYKHIYVYSF